jgi:hypothetical protein
MKKLLILICLLLVVVPAAAQSGNMWTIEYFNNTGRTGNPVYVTASPYLNFNWGGLSPAPNVSPTNFSARMTTQVYLNAGTYNIAITADDEFIFALNGVQYINTIGSGQSGKTFTVSLPLGQGPVTIQVDYVQYTAGSYITANWTYIKNGGYVPPPAPPPPSPNSQSSVVTQYGDYTPCIQQNLHQSNCFVSNGQWNAPNLGSIQLEPHIVLWQNCTPDTVVTQVLVQGGPAVRSTCSKTEAGYFQS